LAAFNKLVFHWIT